MVYNFVSFYFTPVENFTVNDHRRRDQPGFLAEQTVAYFNL